LLNKTKDKSDFELNEGKTHRCVQTVYAQSCPCNGEGEDGESVSVFLLLCYLLNVLLSYWRNIQNDLLSIYFHKCCYFVFMLQPKLDFSA